jgi:hypothetical protein
MLKMRVLSLWQMSVALWAFLAMASIPAAAGTFTVFGPQNYVRGTGAPVTETGTFTVLIPGAQYTLKVFNGGLVNDQSELVSSTVVTLNGVQVISESNFNQNVQEVDVPVVLQGSNTISVQIRGQPGGTLAIQIVGVDNDPPVITARVSPAPNSAGWNKSDVTVTFTCSDAGSGIATCPPAQTVTAETSGQTISGMAIDNVGNSASASVTVKIDKTPPAVTVASPPNGSTISLSTVAIGLHGSVSDGLSGLSSVTCNGSPGSVSGSNFNCTVLLTQGPNSISVQATDVAGNSSSSALALTYAPAPQIAITSPANLSITNLSPSTVIGTVSDPGATITVNGIHAPQSGGSFAIPVPLVEGLNVLTAVATNAGGVVSTATVQVTLDTTPPHITVDSPADGATTTASSVTVTGLANDIVVGTVNAQDVQVTVNGLSAQVANRTYAAINVTLGLGKNVIQATARDHAGNSSTTSVTITRVLASQPPAPAIGTTVINQSLAVVSGNNQTGPIGTSLTQPLVVVLTDPANNPVVNQTVVFKVTGNNGNVSTAGGAPSSAVAVTTDLQGQAQAVWTLGGRAGAGINTVQVSSSLAISPVNFTAAGTTSAASQIVVDSGNGQTGVLGQPLGFPFVADVVDSGHNRVPNVPVSFTVKQGDGTLNGTNSQLVTTDTNGRAIVVLTLGTQIGNDNNVVEASFTRNAGPAAAFTASGRAPGDPAKTSVSGVVLDNSNNPIPGVTIRLFQTNQGNANNLPVQVGTPVQTTANGTFFMQPAPVGFFKLMADGTTASSPNSYPTLEYDLVTVVGNDNTVGMPIYLPVIDRVNQLCVDETHGGTLTLPQVPGFSLTVLPGSATFPGSSRQGCVSVTPVNGDKVPMAPGFGQQPRFIVSIQPSGTRFDPPAPMTLPNVDGLKPRAVTEMYSYDHDLGMFVAIGTGTVSADGSVIASNPGVGVLKAGWHCGGDPNSTGSAGTCPECQKCQGSSCVSDTSKNKSKCSTGVCCDGNCVKATVTIDINNTSTNSDDITTLSPAQPIPAQITLHMQSNCQAHVSLSTTPAGRVTLDQTELDLTDSSPVGVTITPTAASQSANDITITATVNGNQAGTATMTVADVKIANIRASNTPTGVVDRIPPRVDTPVKVTITPDLGTSGQKVTLAKLNANATNGDFTIGGGSTQDLTTTTTVNIRGTVQTAPTGGTGGGNSGNLKVVAQMGGQNTAQSNGFSVAAIPVSFSTAFAANINTGTAVGLQVTNSWTSDSGVLGDLDAVQRSEQIDVVTATGVFSGTGGQVSGFFPATVGSLTDSHSTPNAVLTGNGTRIANQTFIFNDLRTGATNASCPNSGFIITRTATLNADGSVTFVTNKHGAATTANGHSSQAGAGNAQNSFRLINGVVQP